MKLQGLSTSGGPIIPRTLLALLLPVFVCPSTHGGTDIRTRPASTQEMPAEPGRTVTVGFFVENSSGTELPVWAQISTPRGWRLIVADPPFSLKGESTDLRLITLGIPGGATEGLYEVRYTAAPAESPGDSSVAVAVLRIGAVKRLETIHTASPRYVQAGSTYQSSFVVTNRGNAPERIRLRAIPLDEHFPTRADVSSIQLAPQESRSITATVETPPDSPDATDCRVDLVARLESDSTVTATASSLVRILPGSKAIHERFRDFPLFATARWGGSGLGSGAQFELSGGGALNTGGTDHLDVLVRTPDLQRRTVLAYRDEYRLSYSNESLDAYVGDRNFVLSPLTEFGRYAFGAGVEYRGTGFSAAAIANRDRFLPSHPREAGGSIGLEVLPDAGFSLNYLYRQDQALSSIVTGRMVLRDLSHTQADLEVGRDFGDGNDNAFSAYWRGRNTWGAFNIRYIYAGPRYRSYYTDMDFKSAGITLTPLYPLRFDANLRDERRNLDLDTSKLAAPRALYYDVGVWYANFVGVYYRSNAYSDRLPQPHYSRADNSFLIQASYSGPRLGVLAQIELGNQNDKLGGTSVPLRRYAIMSSLTPSPLQSYGITFEYEQRGGFATQPAYDRVSGSLRAGISLAGGTRALAQLFTSKTLTEPVLTYTYLDLELEHRFPFGHIAGFHVRQSTTTPFTDGGEMDYLLEYSIPIDLPIRFSSTRGSIRGSFRSLESGEPISGSLISLDGMTTLTDPSGRFIFPSVQPGVHSLQSDPTGFGMEYITVPQLPLEINVTEAEPIDLTITLVKAATTIGMVTFAGAPPEEGPNTLLAPTVRKGGVPELIIELASGNRIQRRRTDAGGRFEFRGLPPGQWHMRLLPETVPAGYRIEPDTASFLLKPGEQFELQLNALPLRREIRILEQGKLIRDTVSRTITSALPPESAPPKIPKAPSARAVSRGEDSGYTVMISSWRSRQSADRDARLFGEALGIRTQIRPVMKRGKTSTYEVLVGSFNSLGEAEALAALLRSGAP